jgi:hypothetical protein
MVAMGMIVERRILAKKEEYSMKEFKNAGKSLDNVEGLVQTIAKNVGERQRSEERRINTWESLNPSGAALANEHRQNVSDLVATQQQSLQETYSSFLGERGSLTSNLIVGKNEVKRAKELSDRYGASLTKKFASVNERWAEIKHSHAADRDTHDAPAPVYQPEYQQTDYPPQQYYQQQYLQHHEQTDYSQTNYPQQPEYQQTGYPPEYQQTGYQQTGYQPQPPRGYDH